MGYLFERYFLFHSGHSAEGDTAGPLSPKPVKAESYKVCVDSIEPESRPVPEAPTDQGSQLLVSEN
jgi:hypothetical protein